MENKYWVHIHSTTSYLVNADNEEKAEEVALEEFDNMNFDSDNFINQEENKIEVSLDTSE